MIVTRSAPITAASVQVTKHFPRPADGRCRIFLFNVHVESVEVNGKSWTAHLFYHLHGLITGVDEIGFETVERFNGNLFSSFFRVLADSLEILHHQLPLGLPFLLGDKLGPAYGGIYRPDQSRRVKDNGDINQLLNIIDAGSLLLLRAAQIPSRTKSAAERATHQTVPVQSR